MYYKFSVDGESWPHHSTEILTNKKMLHIDFYLKKCCGEDKDIN